MALRRPTHYQSIILKVLILMLNLLFAPIVNLQKPTESVSLVPQPVKPFTSVMNVKSHSIILNVIDANSFSYQNDRYI